MPLGKINQILIKVFGSRNERLVKGYMQTALAVGEFEERVQSLSDEALKAKTIEFKDNLKHGAGHEDILTEAFAVVREAARRNVEMRHFDVQLVGGQVLYEGKIAEMATGEGKTLAATLAVYMVHLTGRKVHIVTVNDYLAKRDAEWMGPVYNALGLTFGAIQADMDTSGDERKAQYTRDVTYGTNNEFGFDYLRDNMKISLSQIAQGPLEYTIIDEVDSILIDEARTPLIISGPAFDDVTRYKKADTIAMQIMKMQADYNRANKQVDEAKRTLANARGELAEAKKAKDEKRGQKAQDVIDKTQTELANAEIRLVNAKQFYEVEFDRKAVHLNHDGLGAAQEIAGVGSFFTGSNMEWPHLLQQSLRAHITFEKEKDYVVMDGKVVIVDEFTGRLMEGRQWSDGLHQAVEAKESVTIKEESQTLATITLQNFFRLYEQIAGMTGTALTEEDEFMNIYKLEVVAIPTNEPCIRDDRNDMIYKSMKEKFNAIVEDINEVSTAGNPVLVGTISVEKSEAISNALSKKFGIEHEVLNAKQHAREAVIVEKAGHQYTDRNGKTRGNVTIATNMAGRGTDIKLGTGVADIGGLHIVGTERHESRRIDNQLRGRAGRQGDAGSSQFFLSFDDDLMSIFAPDWTVKALAWIGWEEGMPIQHRQISKGIGKAQKKVEQRNFESRKSLLEYDEVMDYQRKTFYSRRRQIIQGLELKQTISEMIDSAIENNCHTILSEEYPRNCIVEWARTTFSVDLRPRQIEGIKREEIEKLIKKDAKSNAENDISMVIGEYLEDFSDKQTWNIDGLCKWAMSTFSVNLSAGKARQSEAEEIQVLLTEAAAEQIGKKDCSQLDRFLADDFAFQTFLTWANTKFDIKLTASELTELDNEQIRDRLAKEIQSKYDKRQIEYPIEFAMSMVYRPEGVNTYAFEALAEWAKNKFNADLPLSHLQNSSPQQVHKELLELSENFHETGLADLIEERTKTLNPSELADWVKERFDTELSADELTDVDKAQEILLSAGKEFLRSELTDLERYVLLQIYDASWKDHLYSMDHLKESIFLRAFAEKDPKLEYKQEGFRMFNEMLDVIEDRVTSTIFKVHLEAGARARNVWNVGQVKHEEVNQFAMAERQRAAATAPQGEGRAVKQIKLDTPKVGRNDPCPCGSGKKYKKCCGQNI